MKYKERYKIAYWYVIVNASNIMFINALLFVYDHVTITVLVYFLGCLYILFINNSLGKVRI